MASGLTAREYVFYDGHCGLCHRAVRFLLARDASGELFRFAPLDSQAFLRLVPPAQRVDLPDSIVVLTSEGRLLTRSTAVLHATARLGGLWRPVAFVGGLVPALLRDAVYVGIAKIRHRLFTPPPTACPLLPPELRRRFDLD